MPMPPSQRLDQVRKAVEDPLTAPKEKFAFIYHWMMFEFALLKRDKAQRRADRHGKWLQDTCDVFNMRHQMEDHL
jgi:hypothetical protein